MEAVQRSPSLAASSKRSVETVSRRTCRRDGMHCSTCALSSMTSCRASWVLQTPYSRQTPASK
eukprot:6205232-Pleurochrysis_carterae.AAC.6